MSVEAWEEVQRHGQDFADKLAQGLTGLIQSHITPPAFAWPTPPKSEMFDFPAHHFMPKDFGLAMETSGIPAIFDIGHRIGQAGAELGASFHGLVQQICRAIPMQRDVGEKEMEKVNVDKRGDLSILVREELGSLAKQWGDWRVSEKRDGGGGSEERGGDEELSGLNLKIAGLFGKSQV